MKVLTKLAQFFHSLQNIIFGFELGLEVHKSLSDLIVSVTKTKR